ncbi:hypothetical protein D910_05834 [Dendroctonus ponderosae]|uniref:Major facilitator superfamily (MFS) profile domain-containing protein n=2 Tax=Dendroctonus ponderosae TaxID=77166 RepID=U4U7Z5_DENPD|nr:hypothetical protein D910_05834 [Dendroctonus ponderosae]
MTRPVLLSEHSRIALMHESGLTPPRKAPQFIAAFVSTLSAVCLGMVFSWSSSAIPILEKEFAITTAQGAWVGSLVTLGAFVGAIPAGPMAQLTGRKRALQILIIPLLSSWILIAFFCKYIWVLYIARFLAGISSGGISVAAPMYVTELAHVSIRGTLGTFFQVQITIGILFEYLLGDIISDIRTLSLISAVLPVVFLLSFAFIPESPVYLCEKAKLQDAQRSLLWFRGKDYEIDDELVKITEDIEESKRNKTKLFEIFKCKATYKGLIISFGLMAFQQLSGVNAVLFYTNKIFQQSGGSLSPGQCSILVGAVQVFATLGSTLLIDRAGRKILLVLSDLVMCISLAGLGLYFYLSEFMDLAAYSFIPLMSVALFIVFFSIGLGPIPWMIVSEIFSPKTRGVASSISASLNWFLAFLITNQFANMISAIGIGPTFMGFSVLCGLGTGFIVILVPETKGLSTEEVANILVGRKAPSPAGEKCNKMTTLVIASLITTVLIDRAGRKILLTVSSLAMSICLAALGLYFYFSNFMNLRALSFVPLVSVTGFMASFSIGFGPIPWMIMGEILSPKSRTFLSSLAASINWLLAFLITNQFANLVNFVGIGPTFLGFSVICGLSTIFVLSLVEETKGRSQKEVAHILAGNYQSALYSETLIIICPDIEN